LTVSKDAQDPHDLSFYVDHENDVEIPRDAFFDDEGRLSVWREGKRFLFVATKPEATWVLAEYYL
jgi:hypothetical protein